MVLDEGILNKLNSVGVAEIRSLADGIIGCLS